jgi:Uma2 family endonuclease
MELLVENVTELSEYEIERGKPMPSLNHSVIQSNLIFELKTHYRQNFTCLSELTLEMPVKPNTVPDICIFPKLIIDFLHDQTTVSQMPITAIEIVSPTQSNDDILDKFERYFLAGVQSCWLVMPSFQAISVYSAIGKYQFFNAEMTLIDKTTNIELSLVEIFC